MTKFNLLAVAFFTALLYFAVETFAPPASFVVSCIPAVALVFGYDLMAWIVVRRRTRAERKEEIRIQSAIVDENLRGIANKKAAE